jgi:hypothetical protein
MNKHPEHSTIFNISGCLNDKVIREYTDGKLPPETVRQVEMHLSDCPLCSDAVEGYLAMAPGTDVNAVLEEVRTELFKEDKQQKLSVIKGSAAQKKRSNRFLYIGLAASLVLLITAYFVIRMLVPADQKTNIAQFEKSEKAPDEKTADKKTLAEEKTVVAEGPAVSDQTKPVQDLVVAGAKKAELKDNQKIITPAGKSGWYAVADDGTINEPVVNATGSGALENGQSEYHFDANVDGVIAGYANPVKAGDSIIVPAGDLRKSQETDKSGLTVADNEINLETVTASKFKQSNKGAGKTEAKRSTNKKDVAESADAIVLDSKAEEQQPVSASRKEVNTGADEYSSGNYRDAIDRFEEALKTNPNDDQALYYCGMSYYYDHQNEKALQNLEKVLKKKNSTYYQAAKWQTAIIYRETSQKEKAKKVLDEIIDENGTYKQKAIDAVNDLNK